MKNSFDDRQLELAAKNIVAGIAQESYIAPTENNNGNTVSIKVAKAKEGVRRNINRTIRICAVAAVLMVGLVCALFMGADEVELPPAPEPINFDITYDAYMWKNNSTDPTENMPVKVRLIMKEIAVNRINNPESDVEHYHPEVGKHGTVTGREYSLQVIVSDLEGNVVKTIDARRTTKTDNINIVAHSSGLPANYVPYEIHNTNTELPVKFGYTEQETHYYDEDENEWIRYDAPLPLSYMTLEMNKDFTDFEIFLGYEFIAPELEYGLESLWVAENKANGKVSESGRVWSHENAIFITCGATTREEAIARRYEIAQIRADTVTERYGKTTGFLFDRIKNKAWK